MAKQTKLEKVDPETLAQAQEIVLKIKRSLQKKTSVTKTATELATHLQNIKKEGK
jgi:hypothetical protein